MIHLRGRRDALLWSAVDRIFNGDDSRKVCAELELDLQREQAERLLTRQDRLIALLRETDPDRIQSRRTAA